MERHARRGELCCNTSGAARGQIRHRRCSNTSVRQLLQPPPASHHHAQPARLSHTCVPCCCARNVWPSRSTANCPALPRLPAHPGPPSRGPQPPTPSTVCVAARPSVLARPATRCTPLVALASPSAGKGHLGPGRASPRPGKATAEQPCPALGLRPACCSSLMRAARAAL